jgi:hypothetical protein
MTEQIKSNKAYYFCQFFGFFLFATMAITTLYISPEHQELVTSRELYVIKILVTNAIFFALTHFLLREYVNRNQVTEFKRYFLIVAQCAVIAAASDKFIEWLVNVPEPASFINQNGIILELAFYLFINCLFFLLWSLIYLTVTSIRDKTKLAEQLKDQQLASLMNQINPHFLFNSLNTIRGMIYEDEDKAADLVTQLSTLFRYNLSTDTKAHTSLGKEFEVCKHYLAIEDIRLGDRLKIELNMSAESANAKIPTMGLLTIVENAIKHGIATLKEGGTLTINSEIKDNRVVIDIINPYENSLVQSGTKIGLKNLKQRIDLIFNGKGSLSQKTDNNIFHVSMSLPYEPIENG